MVPSQEEPDSVSPRQSLIFIRNLLNSGKDVIYDETQNIQLLYHKEKQRFMNSLEQKSMVKSKKKSVKEIINAKKAPLSKIQK